MKTVNPHFLYTLLEPLTGLADDDEAVAKYSCLNSNDNQQVRQVIRELIVPHSKSLSESIVARVKLAYRYYLSKNNSKFDRVFNSSLPPFYPPSEPRDFFVWVWEECFPAESFHLVNLDEYVVDADVNEPLRLKGRAPR